MTQGILPRTLDVDGVIDAKHPGIKFIGEAVQMPDGTWRCLANVGGCLCRVEVRVTLAKLAEVEG